MSAPAELVAEVARSSVHTLETTRGKGRNRVLQAAIDQDPLFGRANYAQRYTQRLARLANRAGLGSRAANLLKCSTRLALDAEGRVVGREACHLRDCPTCQGKKSARWAHRLHEAMPAMRGSDAVRYRWVLLTPTVRSIPIPQARAEIRHLHESLDRMRKRKQFAPVGWIRHTEETVNSARGTVHPHVHMLCAVDAAYFRRPWSRRKTCQHCGADVDVQEIRRQTCPSCLKWRHNHSVRNPGGDPCFVGRPRIESGYMRQAEWVAFWEQCARIDYTRENGEKVGAVLDIRAIPGDLTTAEARGALYEITKYATKPSDLLSLRPAQYAAFVDQMRGVRNIGVNGTLSPYLREEEVFRDGQWKRTPAPAIGEGPVATWQPFAKRYLVDGSALAHKWRQAMVRDRLVQLQHGQSANPLAGMDWERIRAQMHRDQVMIHEAALQICGTWIDKGCPPLDTGAA